ncbi:MAG: hypothetical protein JO316_14635 [Abitibacteriaceae bacterium]|nr:hypothetical protein [Abditibacteriaceae bacterium]
MSAPEVIYQMSFAAPGPWLIDREFLAILDEIIAQQRQRLEESKAAAIKQAVDDEIQAYIQDPILKPQTREDISRLRSQLNSIILEQYQHVRERNNIEIDIGDTKRLPVRSFAEAAQFLTVEDKALGFEARLEHDEIVCRVTLSPGSGILQVVAYPANIQEVQQFYGDVRDWVRAVQPTRWQRLWRQLGGFTWPLCFATLPVIFAGLELLNRHAAPDEELVNQAHSLLKHGVTTTDMPAALNVLLGLAVEKQHSAPLPLLPLFVLMIGVVICAVLVFPPPHAVLGIGPGQGQIKRWRSWMSIVSLTTIVFLIGSFIVLLLPFIWNVLF